MSAPETDDRTLHPSVLSAAVDSRRIFDVQTQSLKSRARDALGKLEMAVRQHERELIDALWSDFRKPELEAFVSEISVLYQEIRKLRKCTRRFFRPVRHRTPMSFFRSRSRVRHEPYGAVLVIAPWNYPVQLSLVPVAGAIAAGNSVVLKPSELTPHVAALLETIAKEAFPDGLLRVVTGDHREAEALLSQKFDYIFYTGNTRVGRIVMEAAARHLTPLTLELGGKSPAIVTRNADLNVAAQRIAWGKCFNAGQTCVAPDYVLVESTVHDAFLRKYQEALVRMYGSDPEQSPDYSRIVNDRHFNRISALIDRTDGTVWNDVRNPDTCFLAPTPVTDVDWNDALMSEEIFGPVLPILTYDDVSEMSEALIRRPKPLALYVFSKRHREAEEIFQRVPSGGGCINDVVIHVASSELPFGGVGDSGFGRYRGVHSLRTFTYERAVVDHRIRPELRFRYAPYKGKLELVRRLVGR
ncbi:MAG: aldehyde dehydrogenase family protein [Spirochaetaceae bacterium]|nr:MAG: aldehyde dehydrogenase family protein [Spirochaetaceae bacterium]